MSSRENKFHLTWATGERDLTTKFFNHLLAFVEPEAGIALAPRVVIDGASKRWLCALVVSSDGQRQASVCIYQCNGAREEQHTAEGVRHAPA